MHTTANTGKRSTQSSLDQHWRLHRKVLLSRLASNKLTLPDIFQWLLTGLRLNSDSWRDMHYDVLLRLSLTGLILCVGVGCATRRADVGRERGAQTPGDYVVLLHGLGAPKLSMKPLERRLKKHGYRVVNIGYPSTRYPIEELAAQLGDEIEQNCPDSTCAIHFVTHSMGGIVLRYYLKEHRLEHLGRVVMLHPPSQGSEVVDCLGNTWAFGLILGPAGRELGTGPDSVPAKLGPVDFELGIITGNRSINPVFSLIISGEDDGAVSVERARAEGMADFLVVPHSHTATLFCSDVAGQVAYFLRYGKFQKVDDGRFRAEP